MLRLDHVILRSAAPDATFAALLDAGFPALADPEDVGGGLRSAIVRAGDIDVEVLSFDGWEGDVEGYGLGFTAGDTELFEVARRLRATGLPTSPPVRGRAGDRRWDAVHVKGLLPDPFPVAFTSRAPGPADRAVGVLLGALARVPGVARASVKRPSRSMVVVTRYGFDVDAWRATAAPGPRVVEVEVGAGHLADAWKGLGDVAGPRLVVRPGEPTGVRRVVLTGEQWPPDREPLELGSVVMSAATRRDDLGAG